MTEYQYKNGKVSVLQLIKLNTEVPIKKRIFQI